MTRTEKKLVRDASRVIAKAAIRGTALSLVTLPDGGAVLCIVWGHNPDSRDILAQLTPKLTAEVARRILARDVRKPTSAA
jgi:hypothetical protein